MESVTESTPASTLREARLWIAGTTGHFSAVEFGREVGIGDTRLRNDLLSEFVYCGMIEPVGNRHGFYEKADTEMERIDWENEPDDVEYPIWLPLGLNRMCVICEKNVIVLAGESNAGKSYMALDICGNNLRQNGGEHDSIRYFSCEFSAQELRRALLRKKVKERWKGLETYERYQNFHNVIDRDGFNVIDYLEVDDDFHLIGRHLNSIHRRLRHGIAVVCLQKNKGSELGVGGQFTKHRTRLALSLSYNSETAMRTAKVIKCKNPRTYPHPDGMELDFTFNKFGDVEIVHDWAHISKESREARDKEASRLLRAEELREKTRAAKEDMGL